MSGRTLEADRLFELVERNLGDDLRERYIPFGDPDDLLADAAHLGNAERGYTDKGNEAEPHDRADLGTYAEGPSAFGFFSGLGFRYFRRSCFDIGFAEGVIFRGVRYWYS